MLESPIWCQRKALHGGIVWDARPGADKLDVFRIECTRCALQEYGKSCGAGATSLKIFPVSMSVVLRR